MDILNYFGMFVVGALSGGVFVGYILSKDINLLMEEYNHLDAKFFAAEDKMRRLGIKDGE